MFPLLTALGAAPKVASFLKWGGIALAALAVFGGLAYGVKSWLDDKDALLKEQSEKIVAQELVVKTLTQTVTDMKFQNEMIQREMSALRESDARIGEALAATRTALSKLNLRKARDDAQTPQDVISLLNGINADVGRVLNFSIDPYGAGSAPPRLP